MGQRHFLFLQCDAGPAFRLIARRLEAQGHRVSHVTFNGGDWIDRRGRAISFRGRVAQFSSWLDQYCRAAAVSDLALFGEKRPLHAAALAVARDLALTAHVFEDGYLRPNSIAVEHWTKGEPWQPPRSLDECRRRRLAGEEIRPIPSLLWRRVAETISYWFWTVLLSPLFPRYRSHRQRHALIEVSDWIGRGLRAPGERRRSRAALEALGEAPFVLFPLQLDGDAQLLHRSPFASMAEVIELVFASFARAAPAEQRLVVKRHPYDSDPQRWERKVAAAAERHGIAGRVHYAAYAELELLLAACRGVITVNSTVGSHALRAGKPVHVLGTALYAMPGLATSGDPDPFWTAAQPVAAEDYELFSRALFGECLINAGLHSREGLELLADGAARRMVEAGR